MQTLYTLESTPLENAGSHRLTPDSILADKLERSLDLFVVSIAYVLRIAAYAETDAHRRAQKYLPSSADLAVNIKIAGNEFLWKVNENITFGQKVSEPSITRYLDPDLIRKLYLKLAELPEYHAYTELQSRDPASEKAIVKLIWEKLILGDEDVMEYFSEELPGWEDDRDMVAMLMDNFFKSPSKINFLYLLSAEKRQYARELLDTVIEKKDYTFQLIQPRLNNWDAERVALVDIILLRMGVCELLFFPTIPTKVTINEYIELAKTYSTLQSGQFVNGVLDNILKDLSEKGEIRKQDRVENKD